MDPYSKPCGIKFDWVVTQLLARNLHFHLLLALRGGGGSAADLCMLTEGLSFASHLGKCCAEPPCASSTTMNFV